MRLPGPASSAVGKALDLIEVIARSDRPLRLSELAGQVGLHRATAYRVLVDLVRRGWVLRVGDRYLPGTVVLQLSHAAATNSLVAVARPVLEALSDQTGMMVNLQVLESDQSRVIDVVRPQRLEMITHLREELLPVHKFAGPLVLVAMLGTDARGPYLRPAREAGYPLEGGDGLLADIERAGRTGFALERGRNEKLVASVSRAVPATKGPPICALTIVGPDAEFEEPRLSEMKSYLTAATAELQHALTTLFKSTGHAAPDVAAAAVAYDFPRTPGTGSTVSL
jgi:IclR family transcriptional regulator, acetate operon repressor